MGPFEIDIDHANLKIDFLQGAVTMLANRLEDAVRGRVKATMELESLKARIRAGDWEDD